MGAMKARETRPTGLRDVVRANARDDSGLALVTVVAMSAIMFLLVTSVLTVVAFQSSQVSHEVLRTKAMHVADAGINAYLYELRRDPDFYVTTSTLGGTLAGSSDTWVVTATDTAGTMPLTLRSTGTLASTGTTRTVVATVRYPSLAEPKYTFLAYGDTTIYPGTTIHGDVIVQKPSGGRAILHLQGHVTGFARCYGNGQWTARERSKVLPRWPCRRRAAAVLQRRHGSSGGRRQPVRGHQGDAWRPRRGRSTRTSRRRVRGRRARATGSSCGATTPSCGPSEGPLSPGPKVMPRGTNFPQKKSISPNGSSPDLPAEYHWDLASHPVFYFFSDVYVSGTYSASLTICGAGERIWMYHNILPSPLDGTATLGLVSDRDVGVPWYASTPNDLTVYAAIFAKARAIFKGDPVWRGLASSTTSRSTDRSPPVRRCQAATRCSSTPAATRTSSRPATRTWTSTSTSGCWRTRRPRFPLLTTGSTSRSIITVDSWVER